MATEYTNKKSCWVLRRLCLCDDEQCRLRNEDNNVSGAAVSQESSEPCNPPESSETSSDLAVAPHVGQTFQSDDDAYEYYSNFSRRTGFSIRRDRSLGSKALGIYRRELVCHRAGFAPPKKRVEKELQRDRKSARCKCEAKMLISKDIKDGVFIWKVIHFNNVHNHTLLKNTEVRFLPAYRVIPICDQGRILSLHKGGCSVNFIMRVLELEKKVEPGHLPFMERDVRNFIQLSKTIDRENDACELLKLCKKMKDEDSDFSYDFTFDENQKLEHIAWSYGDCVRAYKLFGDVVVFDTTYRLNGYDKPLGIWVGVDNNGNAIFFGCVLLRDEKARSFEWALQAFLHFMNGKCPQTILTDLDRGLTDAISSELTNTKHAFCIWHILSKLSSWFAIPLSLRFEPFKSEFDRLYNLDSVEEFESQWQQMVAHYELSLDRHIEMLYSHRACWVLPYLRDFFFAGMTTTGPSESITSFLKGFLGAHTHFSDFIEQVGVPTNFRNQLEEATRQKYRTSEVETFTPIEKHASGILTPYAFNLLRHEITLSLQYAAIEMSDGSYLVRHCTKTDGGHTLSWSQANGEIHCSCKQFEFSGILCRHALRVLTIKNYFQLPQKYLPVRWCQEGSTLLTDTESFQSPENGWNQNFNSLTTMLFAESLMMEGHAEYVKEELIKLLNHVKNMNHVDDSLVNLEPDPIRSVREEVDGEFNFVLNPPQSKSRGRPRGERHYGGIEEAKKSRRCHVPNCGGIGHDARNCPMKQKHVETPNVQLPNKL